MTDALKVPVLLALAVLVCGVPAASGVDLAGTARIGVTVSDNINRSVPGFEEEGHLLTQGIGVQLSQEQENRSFLIYLDGGWETLETESFSSSQQIYRLDLSLSLPISRTGWLEGTAGASRETATPERDEPFTERTRVRRSEGGILVGNRASVVSSWEAGVNARREDRSDLDLEEFTGRAQWSWDVSRVRNFLIEGSGRKGSDDFDNISWQGLSATFALAEKLTPAFSRTYTLDWVEMDYEENVNPDTTSWSAGFKALYEFQKDPGLSYQGSVGITFLNLSTGEGSWEPQGSLSLVKDLSATTVASAGIEVRTLMRDPLEEDIERTREGRIDLGLKWSVTREFSIGPVVSYLYEDLTGRGVPDREDETLIGRVDGRWTPYTTWLMEFSLVAEEQESTDPDQELREGRFEIRASSLFR